MKERTSGLVIDHHQLIPWLLSIISHFFQTKFWPLFFIKYIGLYNNVYWIRAFDLAYKWIQSYWIIFFLKLFVSSYHTFIRFHIMFIHILFTHLVRGFGSFPLSFLLLPSSHCNIVLWNIQGNICYFCYICMCVEEVFFLLFLFYLMSINNYLTWTKVFTIHMQM